MRLLPAAERARVVAALTKFIGELVHSDSYDYVVPVERKGTALVRTAMSGADQGQWRRIVSSDAMGVVLGERKGARVLVIDDSVWSGETLRDTVDAVRKAGSGLGIKVTVAAFISHQDADPRLLDIVYYRGLDNEAYEECRDAVVEYLQKEGSLLLDTEHIEVAAKISCSREELFGLLNGWGDAIQFASAPDRVNCTVVRKGEDLSEWLDGLAPQYAELGNAVCKLRSVTRPAEPRSFSLIPIFYPTLSLRPETLYEHPRMKWTKAVRGMSRVFHCVGLSLAVELLVDAMRYLKAALGDQIEFTYEPGGLEHLITVFPEIQLSQLQDELERGRHIGRQRATSRRIVDDPGSDTLERLAREIRLACYDPFRYGSGLLKTLTVNDVLKIGPLHGQTATRASAALDLLIDRAQMRPDIEFLRQNQHILARRVFRPDGELISRQVIREALMAGKGMELALAV
jgi:orotate phosphoribosyltransferase